jgi:hypothetical protein
VVLTADLAEEPTKWELVTFIPLGSGSDELGYIPSRESPTIGPNSFAVDRDGSFWIIDAANRRVAHFSRAGRLLGDIPHSVRSVSTDLSFAGSALHVIAYANRGVVFDVTPDGDQGQPTVITEQGRTVYVRMLIPTTKGLFAEIDGYTDPVATGPNGIYAVDLPGSGYIREVPGLPLQNGTTLNFFAIGDEQFEVQYVNGERVAVQPLRIQVISAKFGNTKLNAFVGPQGFVVDRNDVYIYVKMAASKPDGSGDQIGGRYLLRVGQSPVLFERLPDPTNVDDRQVRHLTLGPDRRLYLMQIDKDAVRIYRR